MMYFLKNERVRNNKGNSRFIFIVVQHKVSKTDYALVTVSLHISVDLSFNSMNDFR